ncbi:MAG: hypothetical protein HY720_12685 [Planctomycetes bacterium]|nr:hypothetical protein [Planctomycetota bacterium]
MASSNHKRTARRPTSREPASIRRLEGAYYLIWATPPGESTPFEVSKEVAGPLQPLCASSPFCPDERIPRLRGRSQGDPGRPNRTRIASVLEYERNPRFQGPSTCPYRFRTKEECYRDINVKAMTQALFSQEEIATVSNFLRALGYQVEAEKIPESQIDGTRILKMHGQIYNFHETRFEPGPRRMVLCMIRSSVET